MIRTLLLKLSAICTFALLCLHPADAANKKNLSPDLSDTKFEIVTNHGLIVIELEAKKAPISTGNFRQYVADKFYDGLTFHRVIPNFMIQGGGHLADMKERKGREPINHESFNGLKNVRGSISMARMQAPNSATSQFFINLRDNPALDGDEQKERFGYAVFGQVIAGMEIVDKIAGVKTGAKGTLNDVPEEPVIIKTVRQAPK